LVHKSNLEAGAALRLWLAGGAPPRPADAAQADALVTAAIEQGVAGLLRGAVGEDPGWPPGARRRLADVQRALLARGLAQLALAARATRRLAAAGVRALPLKGAALAETLYASVADRPMADVDLLVLDDWGEAVRSLGAAGFRELARADHAWVFRDPDSGGLLELHCGFTSCPGLFPVDAAGLWARRRTGPEPIAWVPGAEDLLVQLCLHAAFQHGLVLSLVQHLDIARLLERPLDAALAAELAGRARASGAVAAVLAVSQKVLDTHVPQPLPAAFGPSRLPGLLRWLRAQPAEAFVAPAAPAVLRVRWALAAGQRARFVASTLAPSSPLGPEPLLRRARRAPARGLGLIERWSPSALRLVQGSGRGRTRV
jgi:hypothetical protein